MDHAQTRKRRPIKPATVDGYQSYLEMWLDPTLGDLPLPFVNYLALKGLVARMSQSGMSPKMIGNVIQLAKMIVASAVNEDGEETYPRKWNHEFMDLPEVRNQRRPTHSSETMTAIVAGSEGREQMLYILLGATGIRFGEALGIEIEKHISQDFSILHIRQKVWNGRVQPFLKTENGFCDIDLYPDVAATLKRFVGNRTSGFLYCSKSLIAIAVHGLVLQAKGGHAISEKGGRGCRYRF